MLWTCYVYECYNDEFDVGLFDLCWCLIYHCNRSRSKGSIVLMNFALSVYNNSMLVLWELTSKAFIKSNMNMFNTWYHVERTWLSEFIFINFYTWINLKAFYMLKIIGRKESPIYGIVSNMIDYPSFILLCLNSCYMTCLWLSDLSLSK